MSNFVLKMKIIVKLDIHEKVSCFSIEWGSVLLDRNLLFQITKV